MAFPVCASTLVAGSAVLLALSNRSLHESRHQLATSFLRLADTSERVMRTLARCGCTHIVLSDSRKNYAKLVSYARCVASGGEGSADDAGQEPQDHTACARPHQP